MCPLVQNVINDITTDDHQFSVHRFLFDNLTALMFFSTFQASRIIKFDILFPPLNIELQFIFGHRRRTLRLAPVPVMAARADRVYRSSPLARSLNTPQRRPRTFCERGKIDCYTIVCVLK